MADPCIVVLKTAETAARWHADQKSKGESGLPHRKRSADAATSAMPQSDDSIPYHPMGGIKTKIARKRKEAVAASHARVVIQSIALLRCFSTPPKVANDNEPPAQEVPTPANDNGISEPLPATDTD